MCVNNVDSEYRIGQGGRKFLVCVCFCCFSCELICKAPNFHDAKKNIDFLYDDRIHIVDAFFDTNFCRLGFTCCYFSGISRRSFQLIFVEMFKNKINRKPGKPNLDFSVEMLR